jgi:cyclophilin family peptidyl-prolyl cis-trans isomerase
MRLNKTVALLALAALGMGVARAELPVKPKAADIIKASKPTDWRGLDPENTLYMDLPGGRVVIEMAPTYAPLHAANIRTLVRDQYFDGLFIIRSQDNFVVQWGDPDEEKPKSIKEAKATLKAEFTIPLKNDKQFVRLPDVDGYAPQTGHSNGFPAARDPKSGQAWLTHCYGMVGVGRDNGADSANGSSLYVVTGQAPRRLDRNITVVGRVVAGMPLLSTLPRGPEPMGFYDKREMMVPIKSVRLAADVPEAERSKYEVMRTESATYRAVLEATRNQGGPWVKVAAKHINVCDAQIPVREQK